MLCMMGLYYLTIFSVLMWERVVVFLFLFRILRVINWILTYFQSYSFNLGYTGDINLYSTHI